MQLRVLKMLFVALCDVVISAPMGEQLPHQAASQSKTNNIFKTRNCMFLCKSCIWQSIAYVSISTHTLALLEIFENCRPE
jgi:hypothetical protein